MFGTPKDGQTDTEHLRPCQFNQETRGGVETSEPTFGEAQCAPRGCKLQELYSVRDIAIEWRRVFLFLGVGPSVDQITSPGLVAHMKHAATRNSSKSLQEKVRNYKEVAEML